MRRLQTWKISPMHHSDSANGIVSRTQGFTLLELVLATTIATLVIAILSVALTFSLRMWERQQDRKPKELPMLLELMAMQLSNFDATPMPSNFGTSSALFVGNENSLAIATDHSVKALSGGVPVVARYVYEPRTRTLYYAEIPMDPYHPEPLREFLDMKPGQEDVWPAFYPVEVDDFSIEYRAEEDGHFTDNWNQQDEPPQAVVIQWKIKNDSFSRLMIPNLLFSGTSKESTTTATPGQS